MSAGARNRGALTGNFAGCRPVLVAVGCNSLPVNLCFFVLRSLQCQSIKFVVLGVAENENWEDRK
jgi:hypothetical protein